jgi:hypothetical protein
VIENRSLWGLELEEEIDQHRRRTSVHSSGGGEMRSFAVALALCAGLTCAQAQTFPTRPVTLIVPFPPGGSTDTAARIIGERMRGPLGQTVVIENVGGAGGTIALQRVARAAPDGYTIDIGQWDTHVGAIIYPINFDLQKDFEPVGLMSFLLASAAFEAGRAVLRATLVVRIRRASGTAACCSSRRTAAPAPAQRLRDRPARGALYPVGEHRKHVDVGRRAGADVIDAGRDV